MSHDHDLSLLKIDGQGIEGVGLFSLVTDLTRYLIKKELCLYTTQITKNNKLIQHGEDTSIIHRQG